MEIILFNCLVRGYSKECDYCWIRCFGISIFYQFGRQKYRLVRYRAYQSGRREQIKFSAEATGLVEVSSPNN